ncbi:MAG: hypothetical protein BGO49_21140 [Planctomycetales bacterium 71-10]|nr:MAG: hypothetical protein BGO49_21140 [Planctomycetales bacterium 71-10]
MRPRHLRLLSSLTAVVLALGSARAGVVTVDFEDLSLDFNSAKSGPFDPTAEVEGQWGPLDQGIFSSGGIDFVNRVMPGYWEGFAYSNQVDMETEGFTNQFSVYNVAAHSGSNFGVAFGYHDLRATNTGNEPFNPLDIAHLEGLSYFTLPENAIIQGMYITNATYAALSMLRGDSFTGRPLGGENGEFPDWFKVTAYGTDASGNVLTDAMGAAIGVDFYLGDNRDLTGAVIVDSWKYMDLSALAGAERLYFNVSGTLETADGYGFASPAYFAVDDITYALGAAAVPEPASLAMAGTAVLVVGLAARRRARA